MIEIESSKVDSSTLKDEIAEIIKGCKVDPPQMVQRGKPKGKIYTVEDFTKYHDIEFIENVYKRVLLREVDKGALDARLKLLRSGKRSKTEILTMVRFSKEGREKNIPILGIKKRLLMTILNRIPILNFFIKLFMLPKFMERVNRFEAHHFINLREQNGRIVKLENYLREQSIKMVALENSLENIQSSLENRIEHNRKSLEIKFDTFQNGTNRQIEELEFKIDEIRRAKEQLVEINRNISKLMGDIKSKASGDILQALEREQSSTLDELYISFEDRFRGERGDIKERQSYYLPILKDVLEVDDVVIDLGSGRGEWLELLKEHGIKSQGVDINRLMVKESQNLGLESLEGDAVEYLKSLKTNSVAGVTGFHIVEHIPFKQLIELFDEVYRVLRSGGVAIFETPNPENLRVGAYSFYIDPTHLNPIPPVTLEFLLKNRGFKTTTIHRLHPLKKPELTANQDINDLLLDTTKAQDYSIVGYK